MNLDVILRYVAFQYQDVVVYISEDKGYIEVFLNADIDNIF